MAYHACAAAKRTKRGARSDQGDAAKIEQIFRTGDAYSTTSGRDKRKGSSEKGVSMADL